MVEIEKLIESKPILNIEEIADLAQQDILSKSIEHSLAILPKDFTRNSILHNEYKFITSLSPQFEHRNWEQVAKMGSWSWNPNTNRVDWSDNMCHVYEMESSEFKYTFDNASRFTHPDDVEFVSKFVENSLIKKKSQPPTEYRILTPGKKIVWVEGTTHVVLDDNGDIKEIVGTLQDITDRKQAQIALSLSEERFNLAMQASNDGLFDWNLETNEIYYSPAWKKMLGYADHELPNNFSVWEKTTDQSDVNKAWEQQQKLIKKQIDRFVMEFKMKHKDGHWIDILSRAEAVFDNRGKAIRIVGTHTDITKRKQTKNELIQYRDHLEDLVRERTKELEEKNRELDNTLKVFVGRELSIKNCKGELELWKENSEKHKILDFN